MKFIITKTILLLSLPLSSLLILMGAGILLSKKYPRLGKTLWAGAFLTLYIFSLSPVANALLRPLEARFKPLDESLFLDIDYVAVLGAGLLDLSWLGLESAPSKTSLKRLVGGIVLYRKLPGSKLVLSGGSGDPAKEYLVEAEAMKRVAMSLGVPPEDIVVEDRSRNTLQSVELLKPAFDGKKVILVTSAFHMGRALAMFKKSGIDVIPAPGDYVSQDIDVNFYSLIPKVGSLGKSSTAIYEHLCLSWYSLKGVI